MTWLGCLEGMELECELCLAPVSDCTAWGGGGEGRAGEGGRCSPHPSRAAGKGGKNDPGGRLSGLGNPEWRAQRPPSRDPSLSASPGCDLARGGPHELTGVSPPPLGLTWPSRGTSPTSGHVWGHSKCVPGCTPEGRTAISQCLCESRGPPANAQLEVAQNSCSPVYFSQCPTSHRWRQISSPRILI